jgi:hypothetical protein
MLGFEPPGSAQRFRSMHAVVHNTFNPENVTFSRAARFARSGRMPRKRGRTRSSRRDGEDRPPEPCARAG